MQSKKIGKYILILGLIFLIPLTIVISGLIYYSMIGNLDFNIELLAMMGNLMFWLGWIFLIIGVLILKDFNRDWLYATIFLFIGILCSRVNIILGIIFLVVSIFFALYLYEEKDKHALIVAIIEIGYIVYIVSIALSFYHWIF